MDVLSLTVSGFAAISFVDQLADRLKQLYEFWSAVSEAPATIQAFATELNLLRGVLTEISKKIRQYEAPNTTIDVLESCTEQVTKLVDIVQELQIGFTSCKRHVRTWMAIKAVFKEDKIRVFRDGLERVKTTLLLILHVNYRLEQRVPDLSSTAANSLQAKEPQAITATQQVEWNIIQALYLADYATRVSEIPKWERGTCEWVLSHKVFKVWEDTEQSALLWLSGNPGCGKTVIASFLIDSLMGRDDSTLIYFICDHKDTHFRTRESILRSLIHQLFVSKPALARHAFKHFKYMKDPMISSAKTLWTIFEDILKGEDIGTVYCVLDALDECEDDTRKWVLANLKSIFTQVTTGKLRMIITSRPWEDIEIGIGKVSKIRLKTEDEESVHHDMKTFVKARVRSLAELRRYTVHQQEMVTEALISGANGMFLWVSLMIHELERSPPRNLKRHLKELPETLYDIYDRIMAEIPQSSFKRVMHILKWVVTAIRPLTPEELGIACEVEELGCLADVNVDEVFHNIKGDIGLCGPIITIKNGYVVLVHKSVEDYLLLSKTSVHPAQPCARHHISPCQSHAQLLSLCIKYLLFKEFQTPLFTSSAGLGNKTPCVTFLEEFPFLEYAAKYWPEHLNRSNEPLSASAKAACKLFKMPANAITWFQIHVFLTRGIDSGPLDALLLSSCKYSPLHIAVELGTPSIVEILLSEPVDIDARDSRGATPLHVSVYEKRAHIAQMLITAAAGLNSRDHRGETPLHVAVFVGTIEIARKLLEAGANINAKDISGKTALHLTCLYDRDGLMAPLLLRKGADVNTVDSGGVTPLQYSMRYCRNLEFPRRLIEAGAIVTNCLHRGLDAEVLSNLDLAQLRLSSTRWETIKLILEKETELEALDGNGKTALHRAAEKGLGDIVRFLIERGADTEIKDASGQTALMHAARNGHESVIRVFLNNKVPKDCGVDYLEIAQLYNGAKSGNEDVMRQKLARNRRFVDMQDRNGFTMLYWATLNDRETVVKLLLNGGAKITPKSPHWRNSLCAAVASGRIGLMRLLLDWETIKERPNLTGRLQALNLAAHNGDVRMARLLLEHTALINLAYSHDSTAICLAAENGHEGVVKLLLENGADPRVPGEQGLLPIVLAVVKRHDKVVKVLLDYIGDISERKTTMETILHTAIFNWNKTVAELLIDRGADVNKTNNDGETPLHIAAACGMNEAVRLLLGKGADSQMKDKAGRTALRRAIQSKNEAVIKLLYLYSESR